jgi:hypothetical protein
MAVAMSTFTVAIARLLTKPHNACFLDFARALTDALRTLGHEVAPPDAPKGRLILLGANEAGLDDDIPEDAILYNAEQVAVAADPERLISRIDRIIWDYSEANIAKWHELGVKRVVYCPVGYIPSMTTIVSTNEDIDVLFYGWMNDHRREILDALEKAGLRVVTLSAQYGRTRDRWIARSKIVLNLHYRNREGIFEIFRCAHLFANEKCVVSEAGGCDPVLGRLASRATAYTLRGQIVEACRSLVADEVARKNQALMGHHEFKKINLVERVRSALLASV